MFVQLHHVLNSAQFVKLPVLCNCGENAKYFSCRMVIFPRMRRYCFLFQHKEHKSRALLHHISGESLTPYIIVSCGMALNLIQSDGIIYYHHWEKEYYISVPRRVLIVCAMNLYASHV